jgi:hypothetical protein
MSYDYQAPPESHFSNTMDEGNDLEWAVENDPHTVTFWNAVCAFINHEREYGDERVLGCPSWGQWRSIEQCVLAGRRIEAIKLLRASTCVWEEEPLPAPAFVTSAAWKEFMVGNATRPWEYRGGLGLAQAKSIIELFENYPQWFGRDPHREFSPQPAEHEEPMAGGHVPEEPKSLGDLLREKINAMKAEEGPKEHSLWLNVYPSADVACGHATRERADKEAISTRLACLHITFKEGEGL